MEDLKLAQACAHGKVPLHGAFSPPPGAHRGPPRQRGAPKYRRHAEEEDWEDQLPAVDDLEVAAAAAGELDAPPPGAASSSDEDGSSIEESDTSEGEFVPEGER